MALDGSTTFEKKHNGDWTREQKLIEAVRFMQATGHALEATVCTDLLSVLTAVDDYAKGTSTAMDTIKTNYSNWQKKPNK